MGENRPGGKPGRGGPGKGGRQRGPVQNRKNYQSAPKRRKKVPPQVIEIAKENELSVAMAFKVFRELLTLEDALKQNAEKDNRKREAQKICEKHRNIDFALACLLIKEGMTPEEFLQRKKDRQQLDRERDKLKREKMQKDKQQKQAVGKLMNYIENKTSLQLQKYGNHYDEGYIEDFTPYEFYFITDRGGSKIHRLKLKYFCEQKSAGAVRKMIFVDKGIRQKKLRPSYGPEGRYKFPEIILKEGNEIILALHEGEMLRGKIVWFTPYDILLQMGKNQVWVFRHAVMDCTLARRASK